MKTKSILYLLFLGIILISCEKEEPKTNSDSVLTKANITGAVKLFDENNNPVALGGMFVYLEGGVQSFWTETNKDGSFMIPNALYFNNYTIVYEKQGYGTYKVFGFDHAYTGQVGNIENTPSLGKVSSTIVNFLDITENGNNIEFEVGISTAAKGDKYIRILFHSISEISNEIFAYYTPRQLMPANKYTFVFTKEKLQEMGLESGVKYYARAYGDSYYSNGYFDESSRKNVFPNLGVDPEISSPVGSFMMP